MDRSGLTVRSIWAICLIVAGLNHARILLQHGLFWDYGGVGCISAVYWTSLTVIDPLVALLLFIRPRIGVPATAFLIATNVAHNLTVTAPYIPEGKCWEWAISSPMVISQVGFLIFVVATYRIAWKGIYSNAKDEEYK